MDEAFTNLDEDNKTAVINILREDKGQWVIVSHELYVCKKLKLLESINSFCKVIREHLSDVLED